LQQLTRLSNVKKGGILITRTDGTRWTKQRYCKGGAEQGTGVYAVEVRSFMGVFLVDTLGIEREKERGRRGRFERPGKLLKVSEQSRESAHTTKLID